MKNYEVLIKETLQLYVVIEAESAEEAVEEVREIYDKEGIVLTADDFTDVEFKSCDGDNSVTLSCDKNGNASYI